MQFNGKVVLVTGSGNGIGRATALAFAREGASIVIADIDEPAAQKTRNEIEGMGGKAISCQADVSQRADVERVFGLVADHFGTLDTLVNNVGTTIRKPIVDFSEDEWDLIFDTNVKSMFLCAKEAGKMMLKQQSGIVINISSIHGLGGIPRRLPYSTSKSAVDSLTKTLACEWALDGVRVNAIAPGYILTDNLNMAFESGALNKDDMIRRTPLARLGTPDNIADTALFLSSEKASFITGAVLYVDGGYAAYHGPESVPSFHHNVQ
ncbi:SDR family NAD(P)-dependent oxidoreductase [Paenibacillus mendelii]|uniref:SDR family NAD(P)-dependent oxidoreductase n=1 Tax=Paenibacillus mendelii TaxID=206163 RepID=A0ABV6J343_9BACL|nr:glucose 1-dehydrogenase [Paenibacillus mendelii]MCQ6559408.1 glucose 1-dehydrogenase [Paenibacillus mendelii]